MVLLFNTRDTVVGETPADLDTSRMLGPRRETFSMGPLLTFMRKRSCYRELTAEQHPTGDGGAKAH